MKKYERLSVLSQVKKSNKNLLLPERGHAAFIHSKT